MKHEKKQHSLSVSEANAKDIAYNKTIKNMKKEIYNHTKNLDNARETISNMKSVISEAKVKESKLKSEVKWVEKRLRRLEYKQDIQDIIKNARGVSHYFVQTHGCIRQPRT